MADDDSAFDVNIDTRSLPEEFDKAGYVARIKQLFEDRDVHLSTEAAKAHGAYVTGALLRDSYYDAGSPGFETAFADIFNEGFLRPEIAGKQKLPGVTKRIEDVRRIEVY